MRGAIEIHRALEPFRADNEDYPEGTDIVLLAQVGRIAMNGAHSDRERKENLPGCREPDLRVGQAGEFWFP